MLSILLFLVILSIALIFMIHVMDETRKGKKYEFLDKISKKFF